MIPNPHILDADQLRALCGSGKRKPSAAKVRKWASRQGIRTFEGDAGPWTTIEAVNAAMGIFEHTERPTRTRRLLDSCIDRFIQPKRAILELAVPHGQPLPHDGTYDPSGIYFLIDAGEIAYVGLSVHVCQRISQHFCEGKRFSHIWIIQVPRELLSDVEAFYIHALEPPWNVKYPPLSSIHRCTIEEYRSGAWQPKVSQ